MKVKTIITALAIGLTIGTVTQAGAMMDGGPSHHNCDGSMMGQRYNQDHMQMMNNNGMGRMMSGMNNVSLTPEQQSQVKEIENAYQDELQEKETTIQAKIAELDKAFADETTTIGETNTLRQDLYNLKQDYWQTRRTINSEIGQKLGSTYYGSDGRGPQYCAMDSDYVGAGRGRMMMGQNSGHACYRQ